jgi:hypothetical protein
MSFTKSPASDTAYQHCLPLFTHLKLFPRLDRLILDCSTVDDPGSTQQWSYFRDKHVDENGLSRIRDLRIQLPDHPLPYSARNSIILSDLAQALRLPSLQMLHIGMGLSDVKIAPTLSMHSTEEPPTWMTAFNCLKAAASAWRSADTVRVCVRLISGLNEKEPLVDCDIWVSE